MHTETSVDGLQTLSDHATSVLEVKKLHNGQNALFARRSFAVAEIISAFSSASIHKVPSYLTVQVGDEQHIELFPPILQYMNHSCDPNAFFDTTRMEVIALRDIAQGDEIVFFYPSSEWHMVQPFECLCGSGACLHIIAGADSVNEKALRQYRLTDFIQAKLEERARG